MKKAFILTAMLAAAYFFASCEKSEVVAPDYSAVPMRLVLEAPATPDTRVAFDLKDDSNPIGGFNVTWKSTDRITVIVFQSDKEDYSDWTTNFKNIYFNVPEEAAGSKTFDFSSTLPTIDLSSFDSSKPLKYIICTRTLLNEYWKEFTIFNGMNRSPSSEISDQLSSNSFADTGVMEVPFPTGDLCLTGKLQWRTAALAMKFEIDESAKGIEYQGIFGIRFSYCISNCFDPIRRMASEGVSSWSGTVYYSWNENEVFKIEDVLDANGCRYLSIPADDMTTATNQKLGGAAISMRYTKSGGSNTFASLGNISESATIEAGKCYGLRIKVTDSDGDGVPEFTKL